MGTNLLSRVFTPTEKTKNFLKNDSNLMSSLEQAVDINKNLLIKKSQKEDINELQDYLLSLADDSFKKENQLYQKLSKDNNNFSNAIEKAYSTKDYKYLQTPYNGITLGEALTNLFYGGDASKIDSGLTQFIIEMAHLDTHKFIEDMEISSVNIVTNLIANKIEDFFQEAKFERNMAYATGNQEIIEIFDKVYDEKVGFDFIRGKKQKISDAEAKKAFPKEMLKIIEEAKSTGHNSAEIRKKVQEGNINLADMYTIIISQITSNLIENISSELQSIELKDIDINSFVKEILRDEEIIKVSKRGYSKTSGGFVLASYTINTAKLREKVAKFVVEQNKKSNSDGILKQIEESDVRNMMNDGVKATLVQYNEALYKYIVGIKTNQIAWDYYEKELLPTVTQIVLRDWEESIKPSPVSQVYKELENANIASIHAAEWDKSVKQVEAIETRLTQVSQLNTTDQKQIEDIVSKFNKTDKDDAKMINNIEKAFANHQYKEGIAILRKRLVSKRAGYIANFNGSIGEIFITTIIQKIAPQGFEAYQKGTSKNLQGQSAHADITYGDIGIQSKVYDKNNLKLYEDTKVTFKMQDALRYLNTTSNIANKTINDSELQAFRFFLLNNTILRELGVIDWTNNDFITSLNLRLANFIRYSDGLTDLGDIKNNFFIINFNIVPASVIFLKMADMFKNKDIYSDLMITFTNNTDYEGLSNYNPNSSEESAYSIGNLLRFLADSNAVFKSFTLDLSELGIEVFK